MSAISLNASASGLSAMQTSLDVIANNLANVNTSGFKSSRVNFEDYFYQEYAQPGIPEGDGNTRPTGLYVGLGVQVSGTQLNFTQGAPEPTGQPLDIALTGSGFFQVIAQDVGDGIGYTRAGAFTLNANGQVVMSNSQGYVLEPEITVPQDASSITVQPNGQVTAMLPGETEPTVLGQIMLANFVNPAGLETVGSNIYAPTAASGQPFENTPGENGMGMLQGNTLEASNVDPVIQLVGLIKTQRAFEFNSQVIESTSETLRQIAQLRAY